MKFCFSDESGSHDGSELLVMVGVIVDAHRLRTSEVHLGALFDAIRAETGVTREFKGSQLWRGKGAWNGVELAKRQRVAEKLCRWVGERGHGLAIAAVYRGPVEEAPLSGDSSWWIHTAAHMILQVQRTHQSQRNNKGNTVLIMDEQAMQWRDLVELLEREPAWLVDYPGIAESDPLDQIIATPFFAKSDVVQLIQLADVYAYIFRRFAEVTDSGSAEQFSGEAQVLQRLVDILQPRLVERPSRQPTRGATDSSRWFKAACPPSLASV